MSRASGSARSRRRRCASCVIRAVRSSCARSSTSNSVVFCGDTRWADPERSAVKPSPRVSVVMTVYKDLRFVDEAVQSVLDQTFGDLELIIVDDGNGNDAVFADIAGRDPRIRIVASPL